MRLTDGYLCTFQVESPTTITCPLFLGALVALFIGGAIGCSVVAGSTLLAPLQSCEAVLSGDVRLWRKPLAFICPLPPCFFVTSSQFPGLTCFSFSVCAVVDICGPCTVRPWSKQYGSLSAPLTAFRPLTVPRSSAVLPEDPHQGALSAALPIEHPRVKRPVQGLPTPRAPHCSLPSHQSSQSGPWP